MKASQHSAGTREVRLAAGKQTTEPKTIYGINEFFLTLAIMALALAAVLLRPDRGREPVSHDLRIIEASR